MDIIIKIVFIEDIRIMFTAHVGNLHNVLAQDFVILHHLDSDLLTLFLSLSLAVQHVFTKVDAACLNCVFK